MSALARGRIERAESAQRLNADLLAGLTEESVEDRGSFYVIGQLEEALRESGRVIGELLAELRDQS